MNAYLYGVVRWPLDKHVKRALGTGVGDPPAGVRALPHHSVAALVSNVSADEVSDTAGVRAMRRDMRAHNDVLNRITRHATVLPVRYGTVFPGEQAVIDHVLGP